VIYGLPVCGGAAMRAVPDAGARCGCGEILMREIKIIYDCWQVIFASKLIVKKLRHAQRIAHVINRPAPPHPYPHGILEFWT
jgi:hypothetical protein